MTYSYSCTATVQSIRLAYTFILEWSSYKSLGKVKGHLSQVKYNSPFYLCHSYISTNPTDSYYE